VRGGKVRRYDPPPTRFAPPRPAQAKAASSAAQRTPAPPPTRFAPSSTPAPRQRGVAQKADDGGGKPPFKKDLDELKKFAASLGTDFSKVKKKGPATGPTVAGTFRVDMGEAACTGAGANVIKLGSGGAAGCVIVAAFCAGRIYLAHAVPNTGGPTVCPSQIKTCLGQSDLGQVQIYLSSQGFTATPSTFHRATIALFAGLNVTVYNRTSLSIDVNGTITPGATVANFDRCGLPSTSPPPDQPDIVFDGLKEMADIL
jgi:hypothetical protein